MKKLTILSLGLITSLSSIQAIGYEKADIVLRGGPVQVTPQESSDDIRITNPALGDSAGAKVGVTNDTQLGITASYFVMDNVAVELLAATPFTHDITAGGVLAGAGKIGETKHLPPTLSAHYYPLGADSKFQPYIGGGLNYTIFFEESTTSTLNNAGTIDALAQLAGADAGTVTSVSGQELELDPSFGLSVQVGADYQITDNIAINAAVWWIDIGTTGTVKSETNIGQVTAKVDVDIDPIVVFLGASYKF